MKESKRQASGGVEQDTGEGGGRARDRRMMRKSEREVRGQASDEEEQDTDRRMMGKKSERQANDGEERETGE